MIAKALLTSFSMVESNMSEESVKNCGIFTTSKLNDYFFISTIEEIYHSAAISLTILFCLKELVRSYSAVF